MWQTSQHSVHHTASREGCIILNYSTAGHIRILLGETNYPGLFLQYYWVASVTLSILFSIYAVPCSHTDGDVHCTIQSAYEPMLRASWIWNCVRVTLALVLF